LLPFDVVCSGENVNHAIFCLFSLSNPVDEHLIEKIGWSQLLKLAVSDSLGACALFANLALNGKIDLEFCFVVVVVVVVLVFVVVVVVVVFVV